MQSIEVAVFTSDIERKFHTITGVGSHYSWSKYHTHRSTQNALKVTNLSKKYNITLKLDFYDDQCSVNHGTDVAVELHYLNDDKNPAIYLGSTCDKLSEILSTMASTWNIPVVSVGARGDVFLSGRHGGDDDDLTRRLTRQGDLEAPFSSDARMTLARVGLKRGLKLALEKNLNDTIIFFIYKIFRTP